MEKRYTITFCNCCGKRIAQTDNSIKNLKIIFGAYWKNYGSSSLDEEYKNDAFHDGSYRNIFVNYSDTMPDSNHTFGVDGHGDEVLAIEGDDFCEDCTGEIINNLKNIEEILINTAKTPKQINTNGLEEFSIEQLQAEIEKRNSNKED